MREDKAPEFEEAAPVRAFHACLNAPAAHRDRARHEFLAMLDGVGLSLWDFLETLDDSTLAAASKVACFAREAFQVLLVERNGRERRLTAYFVQHGLDYE